MQQYKGHTGRVRSVSADPTGQYLATGSDDKTVRVWEVDSGRQLHQWNMKVCLSVAPHYTRVMVYACS